MPKYFAKGKDIITEINEAINPESKSIRKEETTICCLGNFKFLRATNVKSDERECTDLNTIAGRERIKAACPNLAGPSSRATREA